MISHIKHDVGTEAIAKKINEIIRVMNEGQPTNIPFDTQLLFNTIVEYGLACSNVVTGGMFPVNRLESQIKGMLGIR